MRFFSVIFGLLALVLCSCQGNNSPKSNWGGSPIQEAEEGCKEAEMNWGGSPIQ